MLNTTDLIGDVPTGAIEPFRAVTILRTPTTADLAAADLARAADLHQRMRSLAPITAENRRQALKRHWEELQRSAVARDGASLLAELGEKGMAWRDVARLVGVSVPAVQKWRRGEGITGVNRLKLAGISALLTCLEEQMITEPVSWLEIPVRDRVAVCPLDLMVAGRHDLVLELASDEHASVETTNEVLDEFDPDWQTTRVDDQFEVFIASDGVRSVRPRA